MPARQSAHDEALVGREGDEICTQIAMCCATRMRTRGARDKMAKAAQWLCRWRA